MLLKHTAICVDVFTHFTLCALHLKRKEKWHLSFHVAIVQAKPHHVYQLSFKGFILKKRIERKSEGREREREEEGARVREEESGT